MTGKPMDKSYRFKAGDGSVEDALRRVALSQIDGALHLIAQSESSPEQIVHEVRKCCKKLRGLLRLVRPAFADYSRENAAFRDMAALLGGARDQDVLILTCDRVSALHGAKAERSAIAPIRARLIADKEAAVGKGELPKRLDAFRSAMVEARERAEGWTLEKEGFDALAVGLTDTLRRARKAMAAAREDPVADTLHEWRKGVKYHWYHARLLRNIWPGPMDAHVKAASDLADLLGDHHDLSVLREKLTERPRHYGEPDAVHAFARLVSKRERAAERKAFVMGGLLLAERPKALAERWRIYWTLWRKES